MENKVATQTRAIVQAYHRGWTSKRFDESIRLLAPELRVEVPLNDYPTRESFAKALARFGNTVDAVKLVAELADGEEAMLLYDMDVRGLGTLRVAEHFTVKGGHIARLRQVHDTAAVRAAGLEDKTMKSSKAAGRNARDYRREISVGAPVERLFDAVATAHGVRGWWTPLVSGSSDPGGTLRLEFQGMDEHIDLRVAAWRRPTAVEWSVIEHTSLDEWTGTTIRFEMSPARDETCTLAFQHVGLSPKLECYEQCQAGWDHFLDSLVAFAEHGKGAPFRSDGGRS